MSNDDCTEDKGEDYQNCSVLCCVRQLWNSLPATLRQIIQLRTV